MRVTVDVDSDDLSVMHGSWYKGFCLLGRPPDVVRKGNTKGFHLIWRGLGLTEEESYGYRYRIGDDLNRLKVDVMNPRVKQVLFFEKEMEYYEKGKLVGIVRGVAGDDYNKEKEVHVNANKIRKV